MSIAIRRLTFPIVLASPKMEPGNSLLLSPLSHFLPPWPIDVCLKVAHLSAMAATICKSSDSISEGWQVRKRTPPLARERRNLRSESDVFYRLLFGRIAPFPCRSARPARILDSVGKPGSGPSLSPGNGATFVPNVTYFTVYFWAGSHRLRATAPDMRESSIVLADAGCPDRDANAHDKSRHF